MAYSCSTYAIKKKGSNLISCINKNIIVDLKNVEVGTYTVIRVV